MNRQLTEEESKWFKSLERCLKKIPKTIEILVQEKLHSETNLISEIHVLKKGQTSKTMVEVDDLMAYNPEDFSCDYFSAKNVAANNHGY